MELYTYTILYILQYIQLYTDNICKMSNRTQPFKLSNDDAKFAKITWIKIQLLTAIQQVENCLFTEIYLSTTTSHYNPLSVLSKQIILQLPSSSSIFLSMLNSLFFWRVLRWDRGTVVCFVAVSNSGGLIMVAKVWEDIASNFLICLLSVQSTMWACASFFLSFG